LLWARPPPDLEISSARGDPVIPMKSATAVLSTLPKQARLPRGAAGRGLSQLNWLVHRSDCFDLVLLAQGVIYADETGRTTGTVSLALRNATPWQVAKLVAAMVQDGLKLQSEVPAWLNQNALAHLA
jgi:hypothetical protein